MTSQEQERISEQFDEIKAVLVRLDDAIRGNGKPGLVLRIDRLERSRATHNKVLWGLLAGGVGVVSGWVRSFWS